MTDTLGDASRAWSWRHAVAKSGLPPTTRHVLLTLSLFMDEMGRSCYPSIADLVDATGLAKSTVLTHLEAAKDSGWVGIARHGYRGYRWRRQEYVAQWPGRDLAAEPALALGDDEEEQISTRETVDAADGEGGPAARPPLADEGGPADDQGGPADGPKVVRQDDQHKTSPETTPETVHVERERASAGGQGRAGEHAPPIADRASSGGDRPQQRDDLRTADGRPFDKFLLAWPTAAVDDRAGMERAWRSLTPEERSTALDHVKPWLEAAEKAGRKHVPAGSTYLRNKPWEIHEAKDEARPAAAQKQLVPPFSKLWWWVLWWLIGKGERVGFMIQQAQQNTSWAIAAEDAPSDEQLGLLWRQGPDDPGFVEWVKHMRQRGVRLPRPDVAPYVWTPSEYPEGAAGSALAGQPASRPAGRMGQEAADAIEDMAEEHIG